MADPTFNAGQAVKVYANAYMQGADQGGRDATIVRQMPDAEDYEVSYTDGLEVEGAPIIVAAGQLRVAAKKAK